MKESKEQYPWLDIKPMKVGLAGHEYKIWIDDHRFLNGWCAGSKRDARDTARQHYKDWKADNG